MSTDLWPIINLGQQSMSGTFPKKKNEYVPTGTLELVKCMGDCGLVQSKFSFDRDLMYGENYGYESAINQTMRDHLKLKVKKITNMVNFEEGDLVIDIGSNDGTLLSEYHKMFWKIGIDPSAARFFKKYEENGINLFIDYFDKSLFNQFPKAMAITTIAMFYDLEDPLHFMMDVKNILDQEGVWVMEQSYMPFMLKNNSYDTICHEHIEYYSLTQIKWMADKVGLKIVDVNFNTINGGSFEVILSHNNNHYGQNVSKINKILMWESQFSELEPFDKFRINVAANRDFLIQYMRTIYNEQRRLFGYGASTKGNVILQYCGLTDMDIMFIADRNPEKIGKFTPGTNIEIISEEEARLMRPDFFFVLPWHFKDEIIQREQAYLKQGGKLLFPLPNLRIERNQNES